MHFTVLVVGGDLPAALAPFYDHLEVAPYARECTCRCRGEPFSFRDEAFAQCRFCRGTGTMESTHNPAGRWDGFIVTSGRLVLRPGVRPLRRRDELEGLCSSTASYGSRDFSGDDWDQARKGDVDFAAMFAADWLTYALVYGGTWSQPDDLCWFPSVATHAPHVAFVRDDWTGHLERHVATISEDAIVSIVDCHG